MTEQLRLDLDRADQQAENCDRAMRAKGVFPIQRAVLIMFLTHSQSRSDDERRSLTISLRAAAAWLQQNVACVRGLSCDHTATMRALQFWIDQGVAAVTSNGRTRTLWLSIENLRQWHDSQPDEDELPLFGAVNAGDSGCKEVIGGDSQKKREEDLSSKKLQSTSHSSSPPEGHQASPSVTTGQREFPEEVSEITATLRELPPLPDDLINARTDQAVCAAALRYWDDNGLKDRLGERSTEAAHAVLGLVSKARMKDDPRAWFDACLRNGVRPAVLSDGAALLRQVQNQRDRPYVAYG